MTRLKNHIILVIVLLLSCSTSWCQIDSLNSPTGEEDSVFVPLSAIRVANAKMLELEYEKEVNSYLRSIVQADSILCSFLSDMSSYYENKSIECEEAYDRDTRKYKKQRNILGSTSGVLLILLVLVII